VSSLPSINPSQGDKVSVWLYNKGVGGQSQPTQVYIRLLASSFSNSTTWSNIYLSWYDITVRPVNVNPYGYWTEFVITDYYNYWKTNAAPNNGFMLNPSNNNNNFNYFMSSSSSTPWNQKPLLRITRWNSPLMLKWPLPTLYASRRVTQHFGVDWAGSTYCPAGVIKKHNGTDYAATAGSSVYAAESGYVKVIIDGGSSWGKAVVVEHSKSDSSKFTTVYWHVVPSVVIGTWVNKGDTIATVANLGGNTHFHFGVRDTSYDTYSNQNGTVSVFSGTGALPQQNCTDQESGKYYPGFPEKFLNMESNTKFSFQ
jgi:murein DD-endopeptidase MepM/ murein hydrolase activator NlpD